ncbi:MAG: hypothetical protein JWP60_399 [Ramlibacter sp.]|nr:hypothetical protein [Ramlibacter sp.]
MKTDGMAPGLITANSRLGARETADRHAPVVLDTLPLIDWDGYRPGPGVWSVAAAQHCARWHAI